MEVRRLADCLALHSPRSARAYFSRGLVLVVMAALFGSTLGCYPTLRYRFRDGLQTGAETVAALTVATGHEAVDGNRVVLLENGARAFPAMLEAIRGATSSIHFETFIFHDGEIGREFVAALAERARAGVQVRLLLDAIGSSTFGEENEKTLEGGRRAGRVLPADPAQHAATRAPAHPPQGADRRRRAGFTGGICIDDAWRGDADRPDRWRETELRVEGPVVRHMQTAFARAWLEATGELLRATRCSTRASSRRRTSLPAGRRHPGRSERTPRDCCS